MFKESIDLISRAALQKADHQTRTTNQERIGAAALKAGWNDVVKSGDARPAAARRSPPAPGQRFATIKAIVAEKLTAYEKYNSLTFPVFLRNIQVYMARHMWPTDPEEGEKFKTQFTETMIAWTGDVMLEAEKNAKKAGHTLIRVEDVDAAVQRFEPHELNQYEDCIYFPRLPHDERITIEAYDLDAFRDPGLHWLYLNEVLNDPSYKGTLEPDPFAAELLTEGGAQMGTLILRVAGNFAEGEGAARLNHTHLTLAGKRIQALLDKNASLPPLKKVTTSIASAPPPVKETKASGTYFTNVTATSGIQFEHRMSDWLARVIRGYTVTEGHTARLASPPAFGRPPIPSPTHHN